MRRAKTMRRRITQTAVFLAFLAILAGCQLFVTNVPATSISLNKEVISLIVGETETLIPVLEPKNASATNLEWKSNDTSIADVDRNGKVTAKAAGYTSVTVTTENGLKAECGVIVDPGYPVSSVSLNKTNLTLKVDQRYTLIATVVPSYATNKNVTWSTDNPAIVRITLNDEGKADGTIFAAAAGTAKITVTTEDGSKTALCTVTVEP